MRQVVCIAQVVFLFSAITRGNVPHEVQIPHDAILIVDDAEIPGAAPELIENIAEAPPLIDGSIHEGGTANGTIIYMAFAGNTLVPGVGPVANEDIVAYVVPKDDWFLVLDGSTRGLGPAAIDALAFDATANLFYLSFKDPCNVPGLTGGPSGTNVDDSDIVTYAPMTQAFAFYFDGSDIGLTTNAEDIDAIAFTPGGNLLISTLGNFSAGSGAGDDKDLFEFFGTSFGAMTAGTLVQYFDGSDVNLNTADENVDAAAVAADGRILLSTLGKFNAGGIPGGRSDILIFTAAAIGSTTIGTYAIYLDSSEIGLHPNANITALEIVGTP